MSSNQIIAALTGQGLLKVSGEDAQTFLHNQFTNDLKQDVSETSSQLSAYCSPKGRILALFRIFMRDGDYYLAMPKPLIEATQKRLKMFVLMSKVTIEDVSEQFGAIGVSGPESRSLLEGQFGTLGSEINNVTITNETSVVCVPGIEARFELFAPKATIEGLEQSLSTNADQDAWELLNIQAGIPTIHPENVEAFVPQMVNLQAIDGLSFKKGCYPGQEIVARMQYLGKLKRRMYLASVETDSPPSPATVLFDNERKIGEVVSAQANDSGEIDLLAVIEIAAAETGPIHLNDPQGPQLILKELPYALDT